MTATLTGRGERAYAMLLIAFPPAFRAEYGDAMRQFYRDRMREPGIGELQLWAELLLDIARSAPRMRLEQLRAGWQARRGGSRRADTHFRQGDAMFMALLTILVGVAEILNSGIELRYGWGSGFTGSLLAGSLGAAAGVVLIAAGIVILRNGPALVPRVRFAAIACLLVFLILRLTIPVFSVFATALGVLFPIALLVWLRLRGGGAQAARVA